MSPEVRTRIGSDLRPEHIDTLRRQVGDDPTHLPAGHHACQHCGIAVEDDDRELTTVTALGAAGHPPLPAVDGPPARVYSFEFATCDDCQARTRVAEQIVAKYPSLPARLGPAGAQQRVENALHGLAALGAALPDPQSSSPAALRSLLARMGAIGGVVWSGNYAPVASMPAGRCAPRPWAGVSSSARLALRAAYAAVLADRVAESQPVRRIVPPAPAVACLFCGAGHVERSAADVSAMDGLANAQRELWTAVGADSHALGGPSSPQPLTGYTCPPCSEAVERVGSVGQTAMERAMVAYLRSVDRGHDADVVARGDVRVVAWGALAWSARRRNVTFGANTSPWDHQRVD